MRIVARYLDEHPEGVEPHKFGFQALINQCTRFEKLTEEQAYLSPA